MQFSARLQQCQGHMLLLSPPLLLPRRGELLGGRDKLPCQRQSLLQHRDLLRLCLDEGLILLAAGLSSLTTLETIIAALTLGCDLLQGDQHG
jgi:hypothetical protein